MIKKLGEKNKNQTIKKIMKKNQVVILALALMLMTAGYMNYTNNHENENTLLAALGDAQLVSTNVVEENEISNESTNQAVNEVKNTNQVVNENNTEIEANAPTNQEENASNEVEQNQVVQETSETAENQETTSESNKAEAVQEVNNQATHNDYFTRSKLERETMYSQMLETYTGILENEKISSEQKDIAENEIKNINDTKNAIMIVENLFETKGFENAIVFVNSPSVNVVIKKDNLSAEEVAQIQNIVQRELKTDIENIHITTN